MRTRSQLPVLPEKGNYRAFIEAVRNLNPLDRIMLVARSGRLNFSPLMIDDTSFDDHIADVIYEDMFNARIDTIHQWMAIVSSFHHHEDVSFPYGLEEKALLMFNMKLRFSDWLLRHQHRTITPAAATIMAILDQY